MQSIWKIKSIQLISIEWVLKYEPDITHIYIVPTSPNCHDAISVKIFKFLKKFRCYSINCTIIFSIFLSIQLFSKQFLTYSSLLWDFVSDISLFKFCINHFKDVEDLSCCDNLYFHPPMHRRQSLSSLELLQGELYVIKNSYRREKRF